MIRIEIVFSGEKYFRVWHPASTAQQRPGGQQAIAPSVPVEVEETNLKTHAGKRRSEDVILQQQTLNDTPSPVPPHPV